MTRASLVWRNRLTHINATNKVDPGVRQLLEEHSEEAAANFQGLDSAAMLLRIESNMSPRMKESAAMNRAMAATAREIDELVCRKVAVGPYFDALVRQHLNPPATRASRAAGLWGGTVQQNYRSLLNLAAQHGLRTDVDEAVESYLPCLTPTTALKQLGFG